MPTQSASGQSTKHRIFLCVQCNPACEKQPLMCNMNMHVQCRPACSAQSCMYNAPHVCSAGMQNPTTILHHGLCKSKAPGSRTLLSVTISCAPICREPSAPCPRIAAALIGHEREHSIRAQGDGAADSYMQHTFSSPVKCFAFHIHLP